MCTSLRCSQRLNNCWDTSVLLSCTLNVIFIREPKSMIGCPSGRRVLQISIAAVPSARECDINSFNWTGWSGKFGPGEGVSNPVTTTAPVVSPPSTNFLRLMQGIRSDGTKLSNPNTPKWVMVGRCKRWRSSRRRGLLLQFNLCQEKNWIVKDCSLEIFVKTCLNGLRWIAQVLVCDSVVQCSNQIGNFWVWGK